MAHNYYQVTFRGVEQAALNGAHGITMPVGMTLVGISLWAAAFGGAPTNVNFDVQVEGSDVLTAILTTTPAGAPKGAEWLTSHFGGANAPLSIAKGEELEIDVNFTAGTTPDCTYDLVLTFLAGTA
jgi:hypothetical protein